MGARDGAERPPVELRRRGVIVRASSETAVLIALTLLACNQSKVPENAIFFDVSVSVGNNDDDPLIDECHPDLAEVPGYAEDFTYALALDGTSATIYIGEDVFAAGTVSGCDLTYSTVVIGSETESDGPVKWQLSGTASVDPAEGGSCVDGDDEWAGTEVFEIVSSEDETLEPGCQYEMVTVGGIAAAG